MKSLCRQFRTWNTTGRFRVKILALVSLTWCWFALTDARAQQHPLLEEAVPQEFESPLPDPVPAPTQYGNSLYFTPQVDMEEPSAEIHSTDFDIQRVFAVDTDDPEVAPEAIQFAEEEEFDGDEGRRLYNVQFPLDETVGESPEDEFMPPAPQAWSPVLLGDGNFFTNAMQRTGLVWSERQLSFSVVPQSNGNFGLSTYSFRATAAPQRAQYIRLTPRFTWHSLNGPTAPDVVSNLYESDFTMTLFLPASDRWSLLGSVAPGVYSDFENLTSDSIRIVGRGLAYYTWSPTIKIMGGLTYLDRQDISYLPAFGVIYAPDADHKYDLTFPRPRVSIRYWNDGQHERWWYIGADLGGGSWAVRRQTGADDILTYRDYRLLVGWEHRELDAFKVRFEAGYAFNRSLEYAANQLELEQPASGVVQLAFEY